MKFAAVAPGTTDLTEPPWRYVAESAADHALQLVAADRVSNADIDPHQVLLVANGWTRDAERLLVRGALPAALLCFDSPVVAWRLYYNLDEITAPFPHTFLYEGARERAAPTTRFHPLHVPVPCPPPRPTGLPWANRRFMVAVADNRATPRARDLGRWFDRPREVSLRRTIAGFRYRPIARERYQSRLRAFEAFSNRRDFDLFGEGWDRRHPAVDAELHAAAAQAYRGPASDRLALLAKYRFALVYEDTRFSGYVTDYILDCFFARCIPIYSGAPDVAQYVPPSAFIDVRQFVSFPDLERFLLRLTEDDARRYVDAAHAFLISSAFERWCAERFARDVVAALVQVAATQPAHSG